MNLLARLVILVLLALVPALGVQIYNEIEARGARAREGDEQALRLARLIADEQSQLIQGAHQLLTALGRVPIVRTRDVGACSAFFADLRRVYPQYVSILSTDPAGHPICISDPEVAVEAPGHQAYLDLALRSRAFAVGEYAVGPVSHRKSIHLAQPYYGDNGEVAGVIALGLSLDLMNQQLAQKPLPPKASVSIIGREGIILARFPDAERFVGHEMPGPHTYLLSGGEGVHETLGFDGVRRIYAYTALPGGPAGLAISVGLEKAEILKGTAAANRRGIQIITAGAILALICAGIGARFFIRRPVQALLDAAERWRRGDLQARVGFRESRSEFGRLGAAFDSMAAAVGAREEELERRVQKRTRELKGAMEARQAAEAALYQAQKMETIGRLTGGVAHDFNNLLAVIAGNIEMAKNRLGDARSVLPRLETALRSAKRGAALTQRLLAFARRQHLQPEVVDLNSHVRASQDVLQRLLRSDLTVETALAPETWRALVDPNQLEAAILNLAINARDAMPNGGRLRLETKNVTLLGDPKREEPAGDFVALAITDTGTGIPPENLDKVFEPFFTTKEVGKGSGLGLSMVHGFARQSSGSVSIESVVGKGTSVTLFLPRTEAALAPSVSSNESPISGEGTVLLVDDDDDVRAVTSDMLERVGYCVLAAASAAEALELVGNADRLDALITDVVLPGGMDGVELARNARQRRPGLPALLITGYSDALAGETGVAGARVLLKPFRHTEFAEAVRSTIEVGKQSSLAAALTEL